MGTGFTREDHAEIAARLASAGRPSTRGALWIEPELVVEVRYKEWPAGGHLRHTVFLRVRDDKGVEECVGAAPTGSQPSPEGAGPISK